MDEPGEFISKSERKRRSSALQDLGARLVELSREQLARLEMPADLRAAVLECKRFTKHEAIRRQLQYIGKVMREVDSAPILEQLAALEAPSRRQTAFFHVAEQWRDELIADPAALERFGKEFPAADARKVQELVAAARAERARKASPRHARELFHAINAIVQQQGRSRGQALDQESA